LYYTRKYTGRKEDVLGFLSPEERTHQTPLFTATPGKAKEDEEKPLVIYDYVPTPKFAALLTSLRGGEYPLLVY
jgi:hypothetical protein